MFVCVRLRCNYFVDLLVAGMFWIVVLLDEGCFCSFLNLRFFVFPLSVPLCPSSRLSFYLTPPLHVHLPPPLPTLYVFPPPGHVYLRIPLSPLYHSLADAPSHHTASLSFSLLSICFQLYRLLCRLATSCQFFCGCRATTGFGLCRVRREEGECGTKSGRRGRAED